MFGLRESPGAYQAFALTAVPQTTFPCKLILVRVHLLHLCDILRKHELLWMSLWDLRQIVVAARNAGRLETED